VIPDNYNHNDRKGGPQDYFATTEEVRIILQEAENTNGYRQHVTPFWKVFLYMLAFTGIRQSEARAIHLDDFPGGKQMDFSKLRVRRAKTGKIGTKYVIEPVQEMIKQYVVDYRDWLANKGHWLFPSGRAREGRKRPFVSAAGANAMFSKLRDRAGEYHEGFNEYYEDARRYRIQLHSLRHWHGKMCHEITEDPHFVKEMLGHENMETTYEYYVDPQAMEDKEKDVYEEHLSPHSDVGEVKQGQEPLSEFY